MYDDLKLKKMFGPHCLHKKSFSVLTLSSLTLHCHLHPLQSANCSRNLRLVVNEDDLKWVKNEKLCCYPLNS